MVATETVCVRLELFKAAASCGVAALCVNGMRIFLLLLVEGVLSNMNWQASLAFGVVDGGAKKLVLVGFLSLWLCA